MKPVSTRYLRLLCDPFDKNVEGAKVDDPMSKATVAYKSRSEFKVIAPAGTTTAAYCITADPLAAIIDLQSFSGGASTTSAVGYLSAASNPAIWQQASLSNLDNYRVVSHGVKIRLMMPQNVCTGRMIIVPVPRGRPVLPWNMINNLSITSTNIYPIITTLPLATSISPYLLELPDALEFSLIDLIGNDVVAVNKPNSYRAFDFSVPSLTDPSTGNNVYIADVVGATTTNATTFSGIQDNSGGWNDFYIYFDGLPSASEPVCNIEVIYHLEGVPLLASATANTAIPSVMGSLSSPYMGIDRIIAHVRDNPEFYTAIASRAYQVGRQMLGASSRMAIRG